jgi:hypothetical protein
MIAHQNEELPSDGGISERELAEVRLGAGIIPAALTFDALLRKHHSRVEAAHYLTKTCEGLDKKIIEAMVELEPEIIGNGIRTLRIAELAHGMILDQDVRTETGLLVAAKGQEVTSPLLLKLKSFLGKGAIANEVAVSQPNAP